MSYKGKKNSRLYDPKEGYNLFAPHYDESLRFLSGFEKGKLFSVFGELKGKKVVDIGCGTGRIIGELKLFGAEVTAVDISEEMLKKVDKKYSDIKTIMGDMENLPFDDETFDVAVCTFVIVHIKDPEKAFQEVYRILKDGGEFILTNINQRKPPKLKTEKGEIIIKSHYHRPEDITAKLEKCLFKVKKNEFVKEGGVWINQIIKAVK